MPNLGVLKGRLRRQIGNPSTEDVSDGALREHFNVAYRDLVNKYRFHLGRKICRFDTVDGVTRYTLWDDVAAILRVRNNTTERKLIKLDHRRRYELTGITGPELQKGAPTHYIRYRDWIEVLPIPDGVYEIEVFFKMQIADLVDDVDVPVIPESWHQGIVRLARMIYYEEEGDEDKAIIANNSFERWVARQPIEVDEEKIDFDSGVYVPTLDGSDGEARLDFDHSP